MPPIEPLASNIEENEIITATFQNMPSISIGDVSSIEISGDGDGIVNPDDQFSAVRMFDCWIGHTNFPITEDEFDILDNEIKKT